MQSLKKRIPFLIYSSNLQRNLFFKNRKKEVTEEKYFLKNNKKGGDIDLFNKKGGDIDLFLCFSKISL